MKVYLRNLLVGVCVLAFCRLSVATANMKPVKIFIGTSATWIEKHAAEELQKYVEAITGVKWEIISLGPADKHLRKAFTVAIGRAETNPIVRELIDAGKIRLSDDFPGQDGLIVQSASLKNRNYLVIGGSQDVGTLYGVYHYLENACGCGFFADGEYIPKSREVPLKNISYVEKAR
ncbi:MAG: alpha-glucuronidase family glycosyl hydrolase, partial [Calditrichia bacterium]